MKTLLALLLLIPSLSWGHEPDLPNLAPPEEYCDVNPDYTKWYNKNEKILDKREVEISKCVLKHASKESSLSRNDIINACTVIAYDKHELKGYNPGMHIHKTTGEVSHNSNICHYH